MTKNGCKIVKLKFVGEKRGFSIETNTPEMAQTHRMATPIHFAQQWEMCYEVVEYIRNYGSKRQANLLRVYQPSINEKP